MNESPSEIPITKPFALTPQQKTLYDVLGAKNPDLASMYYGAIYVLASPANPERFSQSAQSIRELVQKLWMEFDLSLKGKTKGLKESVRELEFKWLKIRSKNGKIINAAEFVVAELEVFSSELDAFFDNNNRYLPTQRQKTSRTIAKMDPMIGKLPGPIMDLRVKEFGLLENYFQAVAHHNKRPSNDSEFLGYVAALEIFLLDRLRPRTASNFSEIDRLIKEGESHA
jgi:hypothetical protein